MLLILYLSLFCMYYGLQLRRHIFNMLFVVVRLHSVLQPQHYTLQIVYFRRKRLQLIDTRLHTLNYTQIEWCFECRDLEIFVCFFITMHDFCGILLPFSAFHNLPNSIAPSNLTFHGLILPITRPPRIGTLITSPPHALTHPAP